MARTFSKKHYIAVASVLVDALLEARDDEAFTGDVAVGVNIVRGLMVKKFTRDATTFDIDKFNRYIEVRL